MPLPSIAITDHRLAIQRVHSNELVRRLGEPLLGGNRVTLLNNEPDALGAMFRTIAEASNHINIESAALDVGGRGAELAQRLVDRCRDGVRVNLLVDSSGSSSTASAALKRLGSASLRLCQHKTMRRWQVRLSRVLQRPSQHQLMVVDGRIGFIGRADLGPAASPSSSALSGTTAAPPSLLRAGSAAAPGSRDLHLCIEGPVVQRLQRLFVAHWQCHASGSMPQARYFPPLLPLGTQRIGVAAFDAGLEPDPYDRALLGAIASALRSVMLTPAQWLPSPRLLRSLNRAARRGVEVQLLLPGGGHLTVLQHAGRSHFTQLLESGVQIHEHHEAHDTRPHARACVVDGVWACIGPGHSDWRSFAHPAEARLVVLDERFASQMEQLFRADVGRAQRVDFAAWSSRSNWLRCKEALARRFAYLL